MLDEQRGAGAAVARFGRVARPPVIADSRHPRRRARAEDADLHAPVFVNKVLKLRVVAAARSSILSPRKPARKCAVSTTKPGSPVLPRCGTGARQGETGSIRRRSQARQDRTQNSRYLDQ